MKQLIELKERIRKLDKTLNEKESINLSRCLDSIASLLYRERNVKEAERQINETNNLIYEILKKKQNNGYICVCETFPGECKYCENKLKDEYEIL